MSSFTGSFIIRYLDQQNETILLKDKKKVERNLNKRTKTLTNLLQLWIKFSMGCRKIRSFTCNFLFFFASLLIELMSFTISRHFSLLVDSLMDSSKGPLTADWTWSVHRMGGQPRRLMHSTLPCTRTWSMESISRLETWRKNFRVRDFTRTDPVSSQVLS